MDADFLDVTESSNKKIAFVLITLTIAILVFGYFFVYQKFHFALKTVEIEINSELSTDVNDYLKKKVVDKSGYKLNISKVKVDTIGDYEYTIKYNNREKKGKVKVVDTTPPTFETQSMKVEVGDENVFLGNFLSKCEDDSKPCLVTFKNESDEKKLNTVGTYNITIEVSDLYKNKKEAVVTLEVVEKGTLVDERAHDLEFASSASELKDFSDQYYEKLEKALDPDSEDAERTSATLSNIDLELYVQENYPENTLKSSEIIEVYNKSGFIIGYVIRVTFEDDTEIYVTK